MQEERKQTWEPLVFSLRSDELVTCMRTLSFSRSVGKMYIEGPTVESISNLGDLDKSCRWDTSRELLDFWLRGNLRE